MSDEGLYDLLNGHAGARWRWIDVRPDEVREVAPVQHTHAALPLDRLLAGSPLPYDHDASLAVFGRTLDDTKLAAEELCRRGYREVLPMLGDRCGGYDWLVHVRLT